MLTEIDKMPPGNRIDYSVAYPTALVPVLARGLAADREERFQTVLELMLAIKRALPDLERKTTTASSQVAEAVRKPTQDTPASEDELDSMTALLIDFMGPMATIVMEEHETRSTSANNLALEISKEIPEQEQQKEFLKRWQMMSRSRRALINKKRPDIAADLAGQRPVKGEMLDKIGNEFTHYVGTIAKTLLRQQR